MLPPWASATHGDAEYEITVWFEWAVAHLDILVVPPPHGQVQNSNGPFAGDPAHELDPLANSYLRATLDAIDTWKRMIASHGAPWLAENLSIQVDVASAVPDDPAMYEIIFASDEWKSGIYGLSSYPGEGDVCVSTVGKFSSSFASFTYENFYTIAGHELGHCLGLNHPPAGNPADDIMRSGYGHVAGASGAPRECASNLDLRAVEGAFARVLGQPPSSWGAAGRVPSSEYAHYPC